MSFSAGLIAAASHSAGKTFMKRFGILLIALGVALLVGSIALFGFSVKRAVDSRVVAKLPVRLGKTFTTEPLTVSTDRACQIAVHATVSTKAMKEETRFDEKVYEAQYRFPISYTVTDEEGNTLCSEDTALGWNEGGYKSIDHQQIDSTSGTISLEAAFRKFDARPPGTIHVTFTMKPDAEYHAKAENVELRVYDQVTRQASSILGGITMTCCGPLVIAVGVLVFIAGLFRGKKRSRGG